MRIRTKFKIDEKNKTFDERVNEWNNLKKSCGNESNEANDYYKINILPEIIITKCPANTRERNHGHDLTDIINPDYMILTVGFSYEPLVLSIGYIKPRKKILFLYSSETEKSKPQVTEFLKLKKNDYISKKVDSDNLEKIDCEIKEQYARWQREYEADHTDPEKNGRVVIDFTGGTKAMAAGGALAGSVIDTKLIYVGSIFDNAARHPIPGTEYIESIKNPYDLYAITRLKNRIIKESYERRDILAHRIFTTQDTVNKNIDDLQKVFKKPKYADSSVVLNTKIKTRDALVVFNKEIYQYASELLIRQESCNDKDQLENILRTAETKFKNFELRLQELENIVGGS